MKNFGLGMSAAALWLLVIATAVLLLTVAVVIRAARIVWRIATFIVRNLFVRFLFD